MLVDLHSRIDVLNIKGLVDPMVEGRVCRRLEPPLLHIAELTINEARSEVSPQASNI